LAIVFACPYEYVVAIVAWVVMIAAMIMVLVVPGTI